MDPATGHRERRPWSEEEDQLLRDAIQREDPAANPPSKWHAIAMHVPSRTNKDCRKRWWAQMATTVAKGGWSAEEDDRLCLAVDEFGTKWALVATRVGTRNSGQCAKRWNDALNPNIDRSEWSDEEDVKLLEAVKTQGKSWTNIVRQYLPGRTGLAAKNRYNHLTRATSDRGRERRKTQTHPYTRSHLSGVPSAPPSSGSTPPHLSREHTPLTPADMPSPALYGHYGPPPGALKTDSELPPFERPTLSLGGMPGASPAPYSPHMAQSQGSMYPPPTPAYRLLPSPDEVPRSAYSSTPTSYFPSQTADLHRGGYHSQPATPATTNGTSTHAPGYFAPAGVSSAHAAHLARAHHHGMALYPTPDHAHASHASGPAHPAFELRHYDAQGPYRLPSMQAVGGEWTH